MKKQSESGCRHRHRSEYDFRKANHDDFILDMSHSISDLVHSPASDRRDTVLANMNVRFSPKWTLNIQSANGWNRKNDPSYRTIKTDLISRLPSNWQLKLSYYHAPDDDRFTTQLQLAK